LDSRPSVIIQKREVDLPSDPRQEERAYAPRAERFPIRTPLRYRESGQAAWSEGTTVNISRSGVLFCAEKKIEPKTLLELRILFPADIVGENPANVICWGPVVRSEPPKFHNRQPGLAVSILRYRFTRE
jgi:hypothetical protein